MKTRQREQKKIVYVNVHLKAVNENALIWSFGHTYVCCVSLSRSLAQLSLTVSWWATCADSLHLDKANATAKKIKTHRNDSSRKATAEGEKKVTHTHSKSGRINDINSQTLFFLFHFHLLLKALKMCWTKWKNVTKTALTPIDFCIQFENCYTPSPSPSHSLSVRFTANVQPNGNTNGSNVFFQPLSHPAPSPCVCVCLFQSILFLVALWILRAVRVKCYLTNLDNSLTHTFVFMG